MKKIIAIASLLTLASCSTTSLRQQRKDIILACTKDLIEHDVSVKNAYKICKDLHGKKSSNVELERRR